MRDQEIGRPNPLAPTILVEVTVNRSTVESWRLKVKSEGLRFPPGRSAALGLSTVDSRGSSVVEAGHCLRFVLRGGDYVEQMQDRERHPHPTTWVQQFQAAALVPEADERPYDGADT